LTLTCAGIASVARQCAGTIGAAALVSWTLPPGAAADINPWVASNLYNPEK